LFYNLDIGLLSNIFGIGLPGTWKWAKIDWVDGECECGVPMSKNGHFDHVNLQYDDILGE
jgi:hypothetical protein